MSEECWWIDSTFMGRDWAGEAGREVVGGKRASRGSLEKAMARDSNAHH